MIAWKIGKVQKTFYDSISKKLNGNGEMWTRRVMDYLLAMTHTIWKERCEIVNTTLNLSYEARLRIQCTTMLIKFKSQKNKFPVMFRNLLEREEKFFNKARLSAIKTWIRRMKLAIGKMEQRDSLGDIRTWLKPTNMNENVRDDDSSINSDDTEYWVCMYPDEDPTMDTWDIQRNCVNNINDLNDRYVRTPRIPWQCNDLIFN